MTDKHNPDDFFDSRTESEKFAKIRRQKATAVANAPYFNYTGKPTTKQQIKDFLDYLEKQRSHLKY